MARQTLDTCPKYKMLVRRLNIPRPYVRGLLELLWDSCHASGVIEFPSADHVEAAAEWPGEPGELFRQLVDTGFLDDMGDGRSRVHDYWDHAPDYVVSRKRMEDQRKKRGAQMRDRCNAESMESAHATPEQFGNVPNCSEQFQTIPNCSERLGNVPNSLEMFAPPTPTPTPTPITSPSDLYSAEKDLDRTLPTLCDHRDSLPPSVESVAACVRASDSIELENAEEEDGEGGADWIARRLARAKAADAAGEKLPEPPRLSHAALMELARAKTPLATQTPRTGHPGASAVGDVVGDAMRMMGGGQ